MKRTRHIVIVGGGFSATATAIALLSQASADVPLRVTLIHARSGSGLKPGPGLAYGFDDDNLLLNVPAGNMSLFVQEPDHFVRYCQSIDPAISPASFVARRLYGQYLQDTLAQTRQAHPERLAFQPGTVVALRALTDFSGSGPQSDHGRWQVVLADAEPLTADHVVLATGHHRPVLPRALALQMKDARLPDNAVIDPWDFAAMQRLPAGKPVLVLGTGHTAVDAAFCLTRCEPSRQVVLVSRHGYLPEPHRLTPQSPVAGAFRDDLQRMLLVDPELRTVRHYLRAVHKLILSSQANEVDWRDVLNALRPYTPEIWQSLSVSERRRFMRHLGARWDAHRHRLAPVAAQRMRRLIATGGVRVIAGHVTSLQRVHRHSDAVCEASASAVTRTAGVDRADPGSGLAVQIQPRGVSEHQVLEISGLVNCTGPATAIDESANPLLVSLARSGQVLPDPLGLGLMVTPQLQVLDNRQVPVPGLWYVGPWLKACYWEATAVPELRVHAARLAQNLLSDVHQPTADLLSHPTDQARQTDGRDDLASWSVGESSTNHTTSHA